jgi:GT2 family glycosyltransferase
MPKVSVIILNYNGKSKLGSLLDDCISSALGQSYKNIEVLFVDNGSTDGSCEYVRARYGDRVKVICFDRNYGFALGNNLASKFVSKDSEYLVFLNPDAVLDPNYVEVIVNFMEKNRGVGVAQGIQVFMDESFISLGGYVDSYGRGVEIILKNIMLKHPIMVLWASGSAMVIRRRLFDRLRGFSPELFLYHDEIDLCSRVWLNGYAVVSIPFTEYRHLRGGVVRDINWVSWYFTNRNRWLTTIRYMPLRNLLLSLLIALPLEFIINMIKSVKRKERLRALLYVRILLFLVKKLSSNMKKRAGDTSSLKKLIVNVKSPLSKEIEAVANIPQINSKLIWFYT